MVFTAVLFRSGLAFVIQPLRTIGVKATGILVIMSTCAWVGCGQLRVSYLILRQPVEDSRGLFPTVATGATVDARR